MNHHNLPNLNRTAIQFSMAEGPTWFKADSSPKGVCLMLHGLNLKPSKMNALKNFYQTKGFHVLRASLRGHQEQNILLKNLDSNYADLWLEDFHFYFEKVESLGLPITLVGFSLGGLVICVANLQKKLPVQKIVLLAPALYTRWYAIIPKLFSNYLPLHLNLISFNLSQYACQAKIPLAFYVGLFELIKRWQADEQNFSKLPACLIFIDPKDELVASAKLKHAFNRHPPENSKLIYLKIKKSRLFVTYHHLIIDPIVLGSNKLWKHMTTQIRQFLDISVD